MCLFFFFKIPLLFPCSKNFLLLLLCCKKWFTHKRKKKSFLTEDIAGEFVAKNPIVANLTSPEVFVGKYQTRYEYLAKTNIQSSGTLATTMDK
jgi:hypothetical protein